MIVNDFIRSFKIMAFKKGLSLIPGYKLCKACRKHQNKYGEDSSQSEESIPEEAVDLDLVLDNMDKVINSSFQKYGISFIETHGQSAVHCKSEAKAKSKKAKQNLDKLNKVKLGDENQVISSNDNSQMNRDIAKKADNFDEIVVAIKDKTKISDKGTPPQSMSIQKFKR